MRQQRESELFSDFASPDAVAYQGLQGFIVFWEYL
jgi:hypothetical protein